MQNVLQKALIHALSEKRNKDLASVTTWVRTRIQFALLRSALMCMRGTRHRYYMPDLKETDMEIDIRESDIIVEIRGFETDIRLKRISVLSTDLISADNGYPLCPRI